ncbi:GntR family transcriptional regulator [Kocuria rosea]|uniref:GntR family transcriptional regulator n=1 Tax=Kocuria rosea TaxID=1275 RepID=UPI002B242F96|nr:GntR family transcriptional regulator [Kocuria rosea]MEB2529302.1 GntR family transcriptional regulator [Kocuria rosea]MEB2620235.1 GntR family transcriptional regulator [Kocuria rosea]
MSSALPLVIDKVSPVPVYHQLAQAMEAAIRNGALAPGAKLEMESDLAARLHVSRPTVRKALNQVVNAGLLVRTPWVGLHVVGTDQLAHPRRTSASHFGNRRPDKPQKAPIIMEPVQRYVPAHSAA